MGRQGGFFNYVKDSNGEERLELVPMLSKGNLEWMGGSDRAP